ncbi:hypothetical protein RH915_07285 [Serpentinicella sp. ANB-PHB4]|uniref:hypothetical protein n=1 Tax=Serpentinicella sp. ANB-PHB4 TaxID=3074076 RepID=UPI002856C6D0|nr:hypothetical protein [Serpentinicella sp. ANB-PHB4]MDR5659289.1 hypothetical protein [Serpentinicella sp. ANB-PHB4]
MILKKSKFSVIFIVFALVLMMFQTVAYADERDTPVSSDEVKEGELLILPEDDENVVEGREKDIIERENPQEDAIVDDGEYNIISTDEVVGEDIEIGEGEAKIVSVDTEENVVGDDIETGEDEASIISMPEEEEEEDSEAGGYTLYIVIGAIVILGAILFTKIKK